MHAVTLVFEQNCYLKKEHNLATIWAVPGEHDFESSAEPDYSEHPAAVKLVGPIDANICFECFNRLVQLLKELGCAVHEIVTADD